MKTGNLFAILFVFTFITGTASFILFYKINKLFIIENLPVADSTAQLKIEPQTEKELKKIVKVENEPEILEENNDWMEREESKFKIKLLETGEGYHGDEIKAKSGETWLNFFEENGNFFLENSTIKIHRVHDPIVDGDENKKTGKSVFLNRKTNSVFLIKNAGRLSNGKISTLYHYDDDAENVTGEDISIRNGYSKDFTIGQTVFTLKAKKGINNKNEPILALILESGGISQTIHSIKTFEEGDYLGSLYWAGDLDRDGKPDFYFSLYFHDNVEYKNLYLSSKAKKGKLIEKVAVFTITGC